MNRVAYGGIRDVPKALMSWWRAKYFNARSPSASMVQRIAGTARPSQSGRCCLFAHYDPQGTVDPYVLQYLQRLRELDSDIVFITTSKSLRDEDIDKLQPICRDIVRRANVSADFGSWYLGIHLLGEAVTQYRQLILANDSVYGPFREFAPVFQEMEARDLDLWGLTECDEDGKHLQSYFLVLQNSALAGSFFADFWSGFRHEANKRRLIRRYEIGLSQLARRHQLRIGSWLSSAAIGSGHNATLFSWDKLIQDFHFPFLKTEILKTNRFDLPRAAQWRQIVGSASDYDCELIANHLRRVGSAVPVE